MILRWLPVLLVLVPFAAGASCPSRPELDRAAVKVVEQVPAPQYRYDLSRNDLTAWSRKQGSNASGHSRTLGLTFATYETLWQFETLSQQNGRGWCHWIRRVDVTLKIPSLVVFVANEYKQGSCQCAVVSHHEGEHVRVNQTVVRKWGRILQDRLNQAVRKVNPLESSEKDGGAAADRALTGVVRQVLAEMYKERDHGNGIIDTADNYDRTAKRCPSW